MEWFVIVAIILGYWSLDDKIKKLSNMINEKIKGKSKFSDLKDMVGKNIEIEDSFYFATKIKGVLKEYDDIWIVLETDGKKNKKELVYYRINNIAAINLV